MLMEKIESGQVKEFEVLEFRAGGKSYGIFVDEISEILAYTTKATPVLNAHPFIEGVIMPRDFVITVIDFNKCVPLELEEEVKNEMVINTSINNWNIGIHVDGVNGIHNHEASDITLYDGEEEHTEFVLGFLVKGEKKVELVDFVKLFQAINPNIELLNN